RTLIAGGTVASDRAVFPADILIADGLISAVGQRLPSDGVDELIDASGLVVMPGAIDMHAHFEDPGHTEREDFTTGTMSAAARGRPPRSARPARGASAVCRGGGRAPGALPGPARGRAYPDRARLQPGQRRPGAPRKAAGTARHDGDLPPPPAARSRRPRPARP